MDQIGLKVYAQYRVISHLALAAAMMCIKDFFEPCGDDSSREDHEEMAPRICLFVLAALLLAAHFLRAGSVAVTAVCLAAPLLLFYRRKWVLLLLQVMAYFGTAIWVVTAFRIVQERHSLGQSWTASAIVLGAVALCTFAAARSFGSRSIVERYR